MYKTHNPKAETDKNRQEQIYVERKGGGRGMLTNLSDI